MKRDATTRKFVKSTEKTAFTRSGTQATNETCKWHILLFAEQEQRVEQFNLVPGHYHGSALADVDTQIRLSNVGMMKGGKGGWLGDTILLWIRFMQGTRGQ